MRNDDGCSNCGCLIALCYGFAALVPVVFNVILTCRDFLDYELWKASIYTGGKLKEGTILLVVIACYVIVCYILWYRYDDKLSKKKKEYKQLESSLKSDYRRKQLELVRTERHLKSDYERKQLELEKMGREVEKYVLAQNKAMGDTTPFSHVADLYADWNTAVFDETIYYLKHKKHPAPKRAEDVKILKEKAREYIRDCKEMRYKYLFLLDAFPELKQYVDDEEALVHLSDYKYYDDFKSERDEVLDYIDAEEYKKMSEDERNQLALDRYKKSKKSNWQIGMQYEMYIGHLLRISNLCVIQYGIENGLQDLGRDIIATNIENGIEVTYIIQCKNWAKRDKEGNDKFVHENVVCQLFGTAKQYEITHAGLFKKIVPWLIITNKLSPMAEKFAKHLGVLVSVKPLEDFPMVKCNINQGNKIYHLPFDQQYYRTQINQPGEFYAWTVKEATDAGFRRARKHMFTKEQ